jgi:Transposase
VATPEQVNVWVGLDVGKSEHFADVLDDDGERLFARAVGNDQADLEALLEQAARHGIPGLVIDQPESIAQLALAVAARRGTPVAYVPGLVMRRAADSYPGEAKTDRRRRLPARPRLQDVLRPQTRRRQTPQRRLICLARRRRDVILAMLRTRKPYRPARTAQPARIANAA